MTPMVATVWLDKAACTIRIHPTTGAAREWFRQPDVWREVRHVLMVVSTAKVAADPTPGGRPHPAGTECPRSIAAFLQSHLRAAFPDETISITSDDATERNGR